MKITFRSATIDEIGQVTLVASTDSIGVNQITAIVTEAEFKTSYETGGTNALKKLVIQNFIEELEKTLEESA